jgi:hypothetical protein
VILGIRDECHKRSNVNFIGYSNRLPHRLPNGISDAESPGSSSIGKPSGSTDGKAPDPALAIANTPMKIPGFQ